MGGRSQFGWCLLTALPGPSHGDDDDAGGGGRHCRCGSALIADPIIMRREQNDDVHHPELASFEFGFKGPKEFWREVVFKPEHGIV